MTGVEDLPNWEITFRSTEGWIVAMRLPARYAGLAMASARAFVEDAGLEDWQLISIHESAPGSSAFMDKCDICEDGDYSLPDWTDEDRENAWGRVLGALQARDKKAASKPAEYVAALILGGVILLPVVVAGIFAIRWALGR